MDMEWPTKIYNPYGFKIHMNYGFFMNFQSNPYGLWIFMDFQPKSLWIMDFLWNGYGFRILKNMDYGMDMDLVLNLSGPNFDPFSDPKFSKKS